MRFFNKITFSFLLLICAIIVFALNGKYFIRDWKVTRYDIERLKKDSTQDDKQTKSYNENKERYQYILYRVLTLLNDKHYAPKELDDTFSVYLFNQTFRALDPDVNIYVKPQVEYLKKKYLYRLDDDMKQLNMHFVVELDSMFSINVDSILTYFPEILNINYDYTIEDEYYWLERDSIDYVLDNQERKNRWKKQMKYLTLQYYSNYLKNRENNKNDTAFVYKADSTLQREAKERVKKNIDKLLVRLDTKISFEDKFHTMVGLIANYMDPHSEYFPKSDKQYFDEQMSKRFFGIGALLSQDENGIKIVRLIIGGPAWKSKKVTPGDYILAVGQGDSISHNGDSLNPQNTHMEDIYGLNINEVVKLIRGKENTIVNLLLKKTGGSKNAISLVRKEIKQEDVIVKSSIIEKEKTKVGYVYIPEFYSSFGNSLGVSSSADFAKELRKLKTKNIDGIIVDLRSNGGGSLYEVIQMVGMLIPQGPVVQVLTKAGYSFNLDDKFPDLIYKGPIVVLVNEFSASASEIFAAAIQDYHRGIVVGSTSTFGKGTVQKPIDILSPKADWSGNKEKQLGSLKVTIQKFYRINGGSTQNKGVLSDIVLSDRYRFSDYLEKNNPYALPWDKTQKLQYQPWKASVPIQKLQSLSKHRREKNEALLYIDSLAKWVNKNVLVKRSLNLKKYQEEDERYQNKIKQFDSLINLVKDSSLISYLTDTSATQFSDTSVLTRNKDWAKEVPKDIYIQEAFYILQDFIHEEIYVAKSKKN